MRLNFKISPLINKDPCIRLLLCSLSVLLLLGCRGESPSAGDENLRLAQTETLQLTPEEPLTLGNIMRVTPVSPDSSRFLVKNLNNSYVNVFGRDGSHLYRFGEPGRGPEEIDRIVSSGFDDANNVVIYDVGQDLLKFFDAQGEFIRAEDAFTSKGIWLREHLFHFMGDGWIIPMELAEARSWEQRESVAVFNEDFSHYETGGSWDPFYKDSESIFQHPLIAHSRESGHTWVVQRTSPGIRILDESLKELHRLSHRSPNFIEARQDIPMSYSRQEREQILSEISLVMQPYLTERYFLFYFINPSKEAYEMKDSINVGMFVAVYDREDYSYMGELSLPVLLTGVIDNKLMLLLNDDPDALTIGLYEINIDN